MHEDTYDHLPKESLEMNGLNRGLNRGLIGITTPRAVSQASGPVVNPDVVTQLTRNAEAMIGLQGAVESMSRTVDAALDVINQKNARIRQLELESEHLRGVAFGPDA